MHTRLYNCMDECIFVCTYVFMRVRQYVRRYVDYVFMYVCMYLCTSMYDGLSTFSLVSQNQVIQYAEDQVQNKKHRRSRGNLKK